MWNSAGREAELATALARAAEMVLVKGPVAVLARESVAAVLVQEPATGLVRDQEMVLVTELAMVPVEEPEVTLALEQVSALDRDQGLEGRFGLEEPVTEPGRDRAPGVQPEWAVESARAVDRDQGPGVPAGAAVAAAEAPRL